MRKHSKMLLSVINSFFFSMRRKLDALKKKPQKTKHHLNSEHMKVSNMSYSVSGTICLQR